MPGQFFHRPLLLEPVVVGEIDKGGVGMSLTIEWNIYVPVKGKAVLFLTKHYAMKTYWRSDLGTR
jgi:hypothetical protein